MKTSQLKKTFQMHRSSLLKTYHNCGDGTYHFKLLVPSVAAGAIIGKGGETIAQLQKETGARVKMSKSHDFYPVHTTSTTLSAICNFSNRTSTNKLEKTNHNKCHTKAKDYLSLYTLHVSQQRRDLRTSRDPHRLCRDRYTLCNRKCTPNCFNPFNRVL
ncbi:unnamed protein product [Brassicogethes aeneus]|uniref:K Homology domain-containing protein n=1 Tax=Brassicogethes aeneus TaxID=1431903 RepID=A0A9P0B1J0_BRAAE|nr:unnamed protein product [Brassicogethes aeneus]